MPPSTTGDDNPVVYDAIVVGTGFAGSATICRLVQAGFHVCAMERGRRFNPGDFPELSSQKLGLVEETGSHKRTEKIGHALPRQLWNWGQGLWELRDLGDVVTGQAAGLGGGSLIYANVHLRPEGSVFDNWPDEYSEENLKNYYDLAAYMLDVGTIPESIRLNLEKHHQMGRLYVDEKERTVVSDGSEETLSENTIELPLAIKFGVGNGGYPQASEDNNDEQGCDFRGNCWFGCNKGAKNSLDRNYLYEAITHAGNKLEIYTLSEVVDIKKSDDQYFEVIYKNHLFDSTERVRAKYVFLCAGAINTTELLFRATNSGLKGEQKRTNAKQLGTKYYTNADAIAAVFDCREPQIPTIGPTITRGYLYSPGEFNTEDWFLVQDAGIPAALESFMGMFRSPLWARKNRFLETRTYIGGGGTSTQSQDTAMSGLFSPRPLQVGGLPSQIARFFEQIIPSLEDNEARKTAIHIAVSIENERKLKLSETDNSLSDLMLLKWLPTNLTDQLKLDFINVASALESLSRPQISALIRQISTNGPKQLGVANLVSQLVGKKNEKSSASTSSVQGWKAPDIFEWFVRSVIRAVNGSEHDLVSDTILRLRNEALSNFQSTKNVYGLLVKLIILLLDHRPLDGFSTMLLLMGRDTTSGKYIYDPTTGQTSIKFTPSTDQDVSVAQTRLLRHFARQRWNGELRTNPLNQLGKRISVHSQGGAAMGDDSDIFVTKPNGEMHGIDGLYVMDAAAFPSPVGVNPSATILAVAEYKISQFIESYQDRQRGPRHNDQANEAVRWAESKIGGGSFGQQLKRRSTLDPINERRRKGAISTPAINDDNTPVIVPEIEIQETLTGAFEVITQESNRSDYSNIRDWMNNPKTHELSLPDSKERFEEWTVSGKIKSQCINISSLKLSTGDFEIFQRKSKQADNTDLSHLPFDAIGGNIRISGFDRMSNAKLKLSTIEELTNQVEMFVKHSKNANVSLMKYNLNIQDEKDGANQFLKFVGIKVMSGGNFFQMLDETTLLRFGLSIGNQPNAPLLVGTLRLETETLLESIKTIKSKGYSKDTFQEALLVKKFLGYFSRNLERIYSNDNARQLTSSYVNEFLKW